jgi:signal transduction histidine kinase
MRRRARPLPATSVDPYARRLLKELLHIHQQVRQRLPLDALLQAVLESALRVVPNVQRGCILVRNDDVLEYRAAVGYDLVKLRQVCFPVEDIHAWHNQGRQDVVQGQDYLDWDTGHLHPDAVAILRDHGHLDEIHVSLITAIYVDEERYGNLVLDNLRTAQPFPPIAKRLAQAFADQVGATLSQALMVTRLEQAGQLLAEYERLAALGQLITGIMHEVNNPLTAIMGHAELLGEAYLTHAEAESLAQIANGALRIQGVVRSLLTFARQQHTHDQRVQLNDLVEQTLALIHYELTREQIAVHLDLAANLPLLVADPGQLNQVLLNLLLNARDAVVAQEQPRTISVQTRSSIAPGGEREVQLAVMDTGPGVDPLIARRIFEPFFTTKPQGRGTGLGLAICYGIIGAYNGRIWVEPAPGGGARFHVRLPSKPFEEAVAGVE